MGEIIDRDGMIFDEGQSPCESTSTIAAQALVAAVAVTVTAATASAMADPQPAQITYMSIASADHGGVYCGQFCGNDTLF